MRNLFRIGLIAIAVVLLEYGLSSFGYLRLVWVAAIVLFSFDMILSSVFFAVFGGLFLDLLLLNNAGASSLAVLAGLMVYLLARSAGLASKEWQKVIVIVLTLGVSYAMELLIRFILGESVEIRSMLNFWATGIVVNTVLVIAGLLLVASYERASSAVKKVKL